MIPSRTSPGRPAAVASFLPGSALPARVAAPRRRYSRAQHLLHVIDLLYIGGARRQPAVLLGQFLAALVWDLLAFLAILLLAEERHDSPRCPPRSLSHKRTLAPTKAVALPPRRTHVRRTHNCATARHSAVVVCVTHVSISLSYQNDPVWTLPSGARSAYCGSGRAPAPPPVGAVGRSGREWEGGREGGCGRGRRSRPAATGTSQSQPHPAGRPVGA